MKNKHTTIPNRLVLRSEELVWNKERGEGSDNELTRTQWELLPLQTVSFHIEKMPPGGSSNIHKHGEAVVYILEGQGYSEIQGRKVNWKAGDIVYIPHDAWHRHFNKSKSKPVKFIGMYSPRGLRELFGVKLVDGGRRTYKELVKIGLA